MKILLALAVASAFAAGGQRQLARSADANDWLAAAAEHEPGVKDAALLKIAEWNEQRLLRALADVRGLRSTDELNDLLERAAMLHADISLLNRASGEPPSSEGWTSHGAAVLVEDGRRVGLQALDPQVRFARRVLAAMRPPENVPLDRKRRDHWYAARALNPRLRQWYRTIAAHFADRHWLADLAPHLESAREILPGEPGILLDSGCLSEVLAAAPVQEGLPPPPPPVRSRQPPSPGPSVLVSSPQANLSDAEKYYRAALRSDPTTSEARVRLARVLTLRGRYRDAIRLLKTPVETADPIVRYFAAIVLADALERDGQGQAAYESYQRAAALYPAAQTPLIAISRLAREVGDSAAAKDALAKIAALRRRDPTRQDPWWIYYDCSGRNVIREIRALYDLFWAAALK